jgi:hypothetical protein
MIEALHDDVVAFAALPDSDKAREFRPGTLQWTGERHWTIDLGGASLLACAPLVAEAAGALSRAAARPIVMEVLAARHAVQVAPALVAELASRDISSVVEVLSGNAASLSWRSTKGDASVTLRIRHAGPEADPVQQEARLLLAKGIKDMIAHVERTGLVIAVNTMKPIVELANEVLREPNG